MNIRARMFVVSLTLLLFAAGLTMAQEPSSPAASAASSLAGSAIVERTLVVPMPDGVGLTTVVYLPEGAQDEDSFPTLFLVTPYGTDQEAERARRFAGAGYAMVTQNVRGQGGSEGQPSPFIDEIPDLMASLEWILAEPWCDGRVGLIGNSSQSYSAQLLASTGYPAIRALVNLSGLTDPQELFFPGGAFRLNTLYPWLQFFYLHKPIRGREAWDERFSALPIASGFEWEEGLLGKMASGRVDTAGIRVPTLHITGWNDVVYRQTLILYSELARRNLPQKLLVGPWMHNQLGSQETQFGDEDFGPDSVVNEDELFEIYLDWFDRFVRGPKEGTGEGPEEGPERTNGQRDVETVKSGSAARVFVMGSNTWVDYESWPPLAAEEKTLYLSGSPLHAGDQTGDRTGDQANVEGSLSLDAGVAATMSYGYDPTDPVPTFGGVNSHLFPAEAGPRDQAPFGERDDVLVFTTAPLESPWMLAGPQKAVLRVSSNAPDADFVVKLLIVRPDGYARIVEDGIARARFRESAETPVWLEPGQPVELTVELGSTAIEVPAGHRIGIHVASSNFPKYDRNPSTRQDALRTAELEPAQQTVHFGGESGSRLVLSVIR
jgi:predicted acyl esterase